MDAAGAEMMDPREEPEEQDANTMSREMAIRIIQVRGCEILCLMPREVSRGSQYPMTFFFLHLFDVAMRDFFVLFVRRGKTSGLV